MTSHVFPKRLVPTAFVVVLFVGFLATLSSPTEPLQCLEVPEEVLTTVKGHDPYPSAAVVEIGMVKTPDITDAWVVGVAYDGIDGRVERTFITNFPAVGADAGTMIDVTDLNRGTIPDPNGGPPVTHHGHWSGDTIEGFGAYRTCAYTFNHWTDEIGDQVPHETVIMQAGLYGRCSLAGSPREIRLAATLGSVSGGHLDNPQYLWDPSEVYTEGSVEWRLDEANLPADAHSSGIRRTELELWTAESDNRRFIYLVNDTHVQRWPESPHPVICPHDDRPFKK